MTNASRTMIIEGMSCMHCVKAVTQALQAVAGVTGVTVDLASKTAVVESNEPVADEALRAAVDEAGFSVAG